MMESVPEIFFLNCVLLVVIIGLGVAPPLARDSAVFFKSLCLLCTSSESCSLLIFPFSSSFWICWFLKYYLTRVWKEGQVGGYAPSSVFIPHLKLLATFLVFDFFMCFDLCFSSSLGIKGFLFLFLLWFPRTVAFRTQPLWCEEASPSKGHVERSPQEGTLWEPCEWAFGSGSLAPGDCPSWHQQIHGEKIYGPCFKPQSVFVCLF